MNDTHKTLVEFLNNLPTDELLDCYREANSWDGSFAWVDAWDLELFCSECGDWSNRTWVSQFLTDLVNAHLSSSNAMIRYTDWGELEEVTEADLVRDALDNIDELADFMLTNCGEPIFFTKNVEEFLANL